MAIYFERNMYRPIGCGYVLKCVHNDKTYWAHKTYSSLQGIRKMLPFLHVEADMLYVYKIPDDILVAVVTRENGRFNLKELNADECNSAKSFYEAI